MRRVRLVLRWRSWALALGLIALAVGGQGVDAANSSQGTLSQQLSPLKDNTLFESSSGNLSNGAGPHIWVGRTGISGGEKLQRGVLAFDISGNIPPGASIQSATLTLNLSKAGSGKPTQAVTVHRLLADWGEGGSNSGSGGGGASAQAGDATWIHTFFSTSTWSNPGGDFVSSPSATMPVGGENGEGFYSWGSTTQMVADIQSWLDAPATNLGWLLRGVESVRSARRFDSKENVDPNVRPVLLVEYTTPEPSAIQFSAPSHTVSEGAGSATITVTRGGNTSGDVSVGYATEGGTATPDKDYKGVSGMLTFADSDTGDKTITLPIIDDGFFEPPETVVLTLRNPSSGATLGNPSAAVLTITDNDAIAGDLDLDGVVGISDLLIVTAGLWPPGSGLPEADANGDGVVSVCDLALVANNLGKEAPRELGPMAVERVFPNLTFPRLTNLVQPDDGRALLFATEQAGRIMVFPDDQGATQAEVFLDLTGRVTPSPGNEEGLLGLAFDPGYRDNGYFYVYYSAASPRRSVVSRFSVKAGNPKEADTNSELIIMEIGQPASNHNGGQIVFGPDGFLYIALGDGGGAGDTFGNGQKKSTLLGSLLRIDVSGGSDGKNYRIPSDNPFVGVSGARDEIWAYGLRNPWRFSFDRQAGDLWLADVGQSKWEEVDLIHKGRNYGWNIMEGAHCFSPSTGCDQTGLELPVAEYGHGQGCSITGGHLFRGRGTPSLLGAYIYGDFCSGKVWGLRFDGASVTELMELVDSSLNISSFGEDKSGNLYVLDRNKGIYKLVPAP